MTISVLAISTTLSTGGAQRFTSTLLQHLDRRHFTPSLALLRPQIEYPLPDDVAVHHLGYRGVATFFSAARRLRRLVDQLKPDYVLSNITATNLIAGYALRSTQHRPRWIARTGSNTRMHDGRIRLFLTRRLYPLADGLVANSQGLADELANLYRFASDRIHVIANPTDFEMIEKRASEAPKFSHTSSQPLLIAVGRLDRQKRYDVMLSAFAKVRQKIDARLWICGEGPERGRIEQQIQDLDLRGHVDLLGFCENPYTLLRQADLFVMSSDHEGLPNALIEAQGLGLPAVSTDCPHGPNEIILEGVTGSLAPVGDPVALSRGIVSWLEKSEKLATGSFHARQSAQARFSNRTLCQEWEQVLSCSSGVPDEETPSVIHTASQRH